MSSTKLQANADCGDELTYILFFDNNSMRSA